MYQFVIDVLRLATATASLRLPDGIEGQLHIPFFVWLLLLAWFLYREINRPRNA